MRDNHGIHIRISLFVFRLSFVVLPLHLAIYISVRVKVNVSYIVRCCGWYI